MVSSSRGSPQGGRVRGASARRALETDRGRHVLAFLNGRVAALDDPRSIGEALKGSKLGEFWKYRVSDYRIIASIEDEALRVLVVRLGNRA